MTMLEDLREVVRLGHGATPGPWVNNGDELDTAPYIVDGMTVQDSITSFADGISDPRNAEFVAKAANFIRTHAAQIEQDARDAELWRFFCQIIDDPDGASEESLHAILDDAINMGSGALNLFIADAMAKESNR